MLGPVRAAVADSVCRRALRQQGWKLQLLLSPGRRQMATSRSAEEMAMFPGSRSRYTHKLQLVEPDTFWKFPVFRLLTRKGELVEGGDESTLAKDKDLCLSIYRTMLKVNTMDRVMQEMQRQDRLMFYVPNIGEEGIVSHTAALHEKDLLFCQYREAGVLMQRGFPLHSFMDQCFGNERDNTKSRQIPVHYGSKQHNFVTISSPLATQMPQASGAAYAFKRKQNGLCVVCYFGDGSASEGDAHAAMNFAATLDCPVLFVCRNNGYAITTPTSEQYRGDGVAIRGLALGIPTIRVDGNDALALFEATRLARSSCLSQMRPALIEVMTYRTGQHSTALDSCEYRPAEEAEFWDKEDNPIVRMRRFLKQQGWWSDEEDAETLESLWREAEETFRDTERQVRRNPLELFTDVYSEMPPRLRQQMETTRRLLETERQHYPDLSLYRPVVSVE